MSQPPSLHKLVNIAFFPAWSVVSVVVSQHLWIFDAIVAHNADILTKRMGALLLDQKIWIIINNWSIWSKTGPKMCFISSCCCGFQDLDHGLFIFAIFNILVNFIMVGLNVLKFHEHGFKRWESGCTQAEEGLSYLSSSSLTSPWRLGQN